MSRILSPGMLCFKCKSAFNIKVNAIQCPYKAPRAKALPEQIKNKINASILHFSVSMKAISYPIYPGAKINKGEDISESQLP